MGSTPQYENLLVTLNNGLQIITFNRPKKNNAINQKMYREITAALLAAASNDEVIIVALTGSGDYYSSGNDLTSFANFSEGDIDEIITEVSNTLQRFVSAFINFPKILVAVVNGPAIGIAVTTLGLCDIVYASERASFSTPFTSLGLAPEGCSSYTFPRIMGTSKASEILYFNKKLSASEAQDCNLVSTVFTHEKLSQEVWPRLVRMAQLPTKSLIYSKALVRRWDQELLRQANAVECQQLKERWISDDCMNAVVNFMQRRSRL